MSGFCSTLTSFFVEPLHLCTWGLVQSSERLQGRLLDSWARAVSLHKVATMSHMNGKGKHLGAGPPCVQWRMFEVSSYVHLGLGE